MSKVHLFVTVELHAGAFSTYADLLAAQVEIIRKEDGCEAIDVYLEDTQQDVVHLWEVWRDRESWDAHMSNESSKQWQKSVSALVRNESIKVLHASSVAVER